MRERAVAEEIP